MKWRDRPGAVWIPGLLAAACLLSQAFIGADVMRLEPALGFEQPWRLFTAHLHHLGWTHLFLNLLALGAIWSLFSRCLGSIAWLISVIICAGGVSLGLILWQPGLGWYVGLSGVLHGLFLIGLVAGFRASPIIHGLLLGGLALKLVLEQAAGSGSERFLGAPVIVDAHVFGVIAGVFCLLIFLAGSGLARMAAASGQPPH